MLASFQQSIVGIEFAMPTFISSHLQYASELPVVSIVDVEFALPPFISSHLHYARELLAVNSWY